ncbi:flagellar export protein FliJ [Evansella sp. AB-P1]|uniref:flagellar export protein FliJ n=1 Tax=Evansella sp. AB-P1 TaxID=3037653 RepID=UPI00241FAD0F|nr:flagellar export protein FliJ [Evansella sp. AB-P1]MDG5788189.1 flagellar export protein FliJ [Evansella sp. AB-P1]
MVFQFSLQKVLDMKEHEKTEAQIAYRDAMKSFEAIATKLYETLKKKEDLLASYEESLLHGLPIAKIQQIQETIQFLQKEIDHLQIRTKNARTLMNDKERLLTHSLVDVKKYEKLKDRNFQDFIVEQKTNENKFLDEISTQQYFKAMK